MDVSLEARALRRERIPQLVGMSVAARILAGDVAAAIAGAAKELDETKEFAEQIGFDEMTAARLRTLMAAWHAALALRIGRLCVERSEAWLSDAHRAEGRAGALEERAVPDAELEAHATEG